MSWWTKYRDRVEKAFTFGAYDPEHQRRAEAAERWDIAKQTEAYQKQAQLERDELAKVKNEQDVQQRRINEKQIRALRGRYRPASAGMLGTGQPAASDMSSSLGG